MDKNFNKKIASNLALTLRLSCGLTITSAIVYIVLCALAIYYHINCNAGILSSSYKYYFIELFLRVYFKQENCHHALLIENVIKEQTVFILVALILIFSILNLITAIICITVLNVKKMSQYVQVAGYTYIIVSVISLVVDLVTATLFGMDYTTINELNAESIEHILNTYTQQLLSLGSLLLMAISLKGFVYHGINILFLILIIFYLVEHRKHSKSNIHAFHKMGALHAFEQQKGNEDPPQQQPETMFLSYKNNHTNPLFVNDEEHRSPNRDTPRSDYMNTAFDRTYSNQSLTMTPRPFSYLEESNLTSSPMNGISQWQRDRDVWQPPVPAPDYSPEAPRRLKSALKSSYM
ncbi:uncharacterized protein LOC113520815 isoform X2 [Galleria mellonella]|uniref:Uncharacterized protein LOC113520815 isoform X2 n=1 Tax=Galleria mellonella TaxID=7137 RepID=A0A6J1X6S2_GALME|nr:uncharacterized protein LOC113520815 isoform X2 [Galleria mellonella]